MSKKKERKVRKFRNIAVLNEVNRKAGVHIESKSGKRSREKHSLKQEILNDSDTCRLPD